MPLEVQCTHCGETLWVPDEFAGRAGRCHACGGTVVAPGPKQAPSEAGAPRPEAHEWAVLLDTASQVRFDPVEHHRALARALGLKPRDALQALARTQGILTRDRTRAEAEDLITALNLLELFGRVEPASRLVPPPPAMHVRRVQLEDEFLVVPGDQSHPELRLAWSNIIALNRGRAPSRRPDPTEVRASAGMLPAARLAAQSSGENDDRLIGGQLVADIVSEEPLVRLRISSETMDFTLLGARATDDPYANMRVVFSVIMVHCRRVLMNAPGPELLPASDAAEVDPLGGRLFEARTEWLYCLARLGRSE